MHMSLTTVTRVLVTQWLCMHVSLTTVTRVLVTQWLCMHVSLTTVTRVLVTQWLCMHVSFTSETEVFVILLWRDSSKRVNVYSEKNELALSTTTAKHFKISTEFTIFIHIQQIIS